ncbi:NADH-quinone oxidoreductase subunit NuoN [Kangiella sp. TOML190]|uniref:NADH-quinone oxidoreductase subunit NuoN n=1 Tax=Kangiella sp. TOML190 TaxID=2931351 RepID=UPI00203EA8FB|nr:NADH-quinone oxidoreductase subunit NuoN [Kangiella sp. TOML190]
MDFNLLALVSQALPNVSIGFSHNFWPLLPEIFLLTAASVLLLIDVYSADIDRRLSYKLAQLILIATGIIILFQFPTSQDFLFHRHFIHDPLSATLKISMLILTSISLVFARPYILQRRILRGEYYLLHLFALLGMMLLVSGASLLSLYLGLELMSLCLYALVAMNRREKMSAEAAVKYFVMGAIASGFLLYGISFVYGVTGNIHIADIAAYLTENEASLTLRFALVFIVVGIAFKFGAVPFQMWVPDVYHGAPTATTVFLASAPKVAVFGLAIRVLVFGFAGALLDWQSLLIILAVLSMLVGNLVALAQTNIKRLLAYSAIAHIGYFLLGFIAGNSQGYSASLFYILTYALTALGGFGCLIYMAKGQQEIQLIDDLKGLGARNPWAGLLISFLFLSMAGLPPFIGFWAKLEVIQAVLNSDNGNFVWLAIVAAVMSIVGLFYYLKVVKVIFFDKPEVENPIRADRSLRLGLGLTGIAVIALGLFPAQLIDFCQKAFQYI